MAVNPRARFASGLGAILVLALTACANQAPAPVTDGAPPAVPAMPARATEPEVASRSEALTRLIDTAAQAYDAGDHQRAIDLAERGLRMDRYAPELYLILAQGYAGLGMHDQSVSFARLGLRYISAKPELKPELQALAEAE